MLVVMLKSFSREGRIPMTMRPDMAPVRRAKRVWYRMVLIGVSLKMPKKKDARAMERPV